MILSRVYWLALLCFFVGSSLCAEEYIPGRPVEASFKKIVPLSAPIVLVVILTNVSSASSRVFVFAKSVVTWSNISEKRSVLFDLAFLKVLFLLSSVVIFDFGTKFDYSFLQLFKLHGFLLLFLL